ncbi:50S ribosomal protein L10 [Gimesia chilikensis]|uniref:Large ribosomal subunit protein uL10 n=1 Tax=Gimesia chilikensis TaxID=2605989 RepID=A0A517WJM9_9PLAN|nr:50S ribosomal protein L10 [Gimesia chilikensis]QDU05433.1 50S ribosomal protein L10 [Gimesia chilikensis]
MSKYVKELIISEIESHISDVRDFVVIDSAKVDAITDNSFRLKLQEKGLTALTVKNSLARRAFANKGIEGLGEVLKGPSTLVWGGEDIVELSKEMSKWAKEIQELDIKGGLTEGTSLTTDDVTKLSKSPGRIELIADIVGRILGPGSQLASAIKGPGVTVVGQVKSISEDEELTLSRLKALASAKKNIAAKTEEPKDGEGDVATLIAVEDPTEKKFQTDESENAHLNNGQTDIASPNDWRSNIGPVKEHGDITSPPITIHLEARDSMGGQFKDPSMITQSLKLVMSTDSDHGIKEALAIRDPNMDLLDLVGDDSLIESASIDLGINAAFVSHSRRCEFILIGWHTFAEPKRVLDFLNHEFNTSPHNLSVFKNFAGKRIFNLRVENTHSEEELKQTLSNFQSVNSGRIVVESNDEMWEIWVERDPLLGSICSDKPIIVVTFSTKLLNSQSKNRLCKLVENTGVAFSESHNQTWLVDQIRNLQKDKA